ncbi:MAG: isochorismate synthase [Pseudanabaenaceae cyanobacterium bins.68]|nr:isochorismate synthase [Pseudanabaenaceae cyanobacterium bins.68]
MQAPSRLVDLVGKAIAQAKVEGLPVLLCWSGVWPQQDGLALLAKSAQTRWWFWQQPGLQMVAGGIAVGAPINAERFGVAQQFAQDYLARSLVGGDDINRCPIAVAGFSFYDRVTPMWWQFPGAEVYVPEWLLQSTETETSLRVHVLVQASSEVEQVCAQIERCWSSLASWSGLDFSWQEQPNQIEYQEVEGDRHWSEMVTQAKAMITAGNLTKIVLARSLEITATLPINPLNLLNRLRTNYPECVCFGINLGGAASFIGATPEFLLQFSLEGGRLHLRSDALAGSSRRGLTLDQDRALGEELLHSAKNGLEHQIVVNSIRDRLLESGANLEPTIPPRLLQLKNVQHLHTVIKGQLLPRAQFQCLEILARLHPTAAMGGEPRQAALAIMRDWEASDRGWYAAPIGWFGGGKNQEEGAFVVGIRSGYVQANRARIFAGAGIVAESDLATELEETTLKFAALLQAIA